MVRHLCRRSLWWEVGYTWGISWQRKKGNKECVIVYDANKSNTDWLLLPNVQHIQILSRFSVMIKMCACEYVKLKALTCYWPFPVVHLLKQQNYSGQSLNLPEPEKRRVIKWVRLCFIIFEILTYLILQYLCKRGNNHVITVSAKKDKILITAAQAFSIYSFPYLSFHLWIKHEH